MFNQECSELANDGKQAKLIRLQNPNDQTAKDFINVRRDNCKDFKKKKVITWKLEENSKNQIIQEMYKGINEIKKVNQSRAYEIKKYDGTIVTY